MPDKPPSILSASWKVFQLLDGPDKRRIFALLGLMSVNAVLEMLNIALFLPLIQLALKPEEATGIAIVDNALESLGHIEIVSPFVIFAAFLLGIFLVKNALIAYVVYAQSHAVKKIQANLTTELVRAYTLKPYEDHLAINSANAVFDMSVTAPRVISGIFLPLLSMIMEGLLALGAGLALLAITYKGAVLAGGGVIMAMGLFYLVVRGRIFRLGREVQALSKDVARLAHSCLGMTKENYTLDRSHFFVEKVDTATQQRAKSDATLQFINQLPRIYGEVVIVTVMLLTMMIIIQEQGSIQTALPILGVFAVAGFKVFPSVNRIVHYAATLKQVTAIVDDVYCDLKEAKEAALLEAETPQSAPITFEKDIRLDNMSYFYPQSSGPALNDIELTIKKGEAIAFVGSTGAGKSTVVDVILGLLPPRQGHVLVDGAPTFPGPFSWKGLIGYVPQSIFLLDDAIRRNIALGLDDEEIDDTRVAEVLEIAQLSQFIDGLPDGLDTIIGERGVRLSGGQRQRIGIARALYHKPEILVMDEATSALDSRTEKTITQAIEVLRQQMTMIIIAHRLSTVRNCDRLFFLKDGRLNDSGTYDELIARNEDFRYMAAHPEPEKETANE
jgi:ATP-binding cassette, subfamily B, bacterial PglK